MGKEKRLLGCSIVLNVLVTVQDLCLEQSWVLVPQLSSLAVQWRCTEVRISRVLR